MGIYDFDKSEKYSNLDERVDFRSDDSILNPLQSIYDHNSPDIATAEMIALENLRVCGAWVTVLPKSEDNKFTAVWMEDANPTYYSGYDFKAFFPPAPPEVILTKFGHDAPNKFDISFSRAEVIKVLGERLIRIGDIVIVPHNSLVLKAKRYRVLHVAEKGNFRYRWIYISVSVENINFDSAFEPQIK